MRVHGIIFFARLNETAPGYNYALILASNRAVPAFFRLQEENLGWLGSRLPSFFMLTARYNDIVQVTCEVIILQVQTAYKNYRRKQDGMREEMVHNSTFTDLGAIPSRTLQIQFKYILEAYSFSPTNVPPGLELQQLQPWHLVY